MTTTESYFNPREQSLHYSDRNCKMLYIHCNFKLTLHSKKLSRKVELYKFFICNIYIYKFIFCNIINVFI